MNYEYDQKSVDMMTNLLSGLNDIEAGNVSASSGEYYNTGGDIGAMTDILTSLNEAGMNYGEPVKQHVTTYDSTYAITPPPSGSSQSMQKQQNMVQPKTNWSLVEEKVSGTKNTKTYSIKSNHSSQILMNNIMMYEAALTLVNLLNEGRVLTDAKILGIISSGMQFTYVMNEALSAAKKRKQVLNESRYDEAKELDILISEKKSEAFKLKERVINYLKNEGYIK